MKRFWVFILLFLAAGFTLAQDMPPLPSDAPASAVSGKDDTMPALPDTGVSTAPPAKAAPVSAASNDMPALPNPVADTSTPSTSDMPALPEVGGGSAAPAKPASPAPTKDVSPTPVPINIMPASPDAVGVSTAPSTTAMPVLPNAAGTSQSPSADNDMPTLPDENAAIIAPAKPTPASPGQVGGSVAPGAAVPYTITAPPGSEDLNSTSLTSKKTKFTQPKSAVEKQPWKESKFRPDTILGGWIKAKGGNMTSKLSWASQQVLNAMDAKKYKMAKEEGVYEGEQNKGPQNRRFTFNVPGTKDSVIVLLKQSGTRIWLRVGPDEEPAPANHTYAEVAKISKEDQTVLRILKAKFGYRMAPHHMVPSYEAKFDRQRETADE